MNPETAKKLLSLGTEVAGAAIDGAAPDPASVARQLVSLGLDLVPEDELRGFLSAEAAARIDAELDAEQRAKTGGQ